MVVYVVHTELWKPDHEGAKFLGSVVEGVFDSEEKAMEYIREDYECSISIRDGFECDYGRLYHCDTDEGMANILVESWEVN